MPDRTLNTVVFIGLTANPTRADEETREWFVGTAFFVSYPSTKRPDIAFAYLVTANHVADEVEGKDFWILSNTHEGTALKLVAAGARWWRHPQGRAVDVAVLPMRPDDRHDWVGVPPSRMLTRERMRSFGVGIGDEVAILGLFGQFAGRTKITPIVRTGNIAMLPDEKIQTRDLGLIDAYLVEVRSFGGLSGSAVFVSETITLNVDTPPGREPPAEAGIYPFSGTGNFFLLGLVHGHWQVAEEDANANTFRSPAGSPGINLGIAIIVPAEKILETLDQPGLAKIRADNA